MLVVNIFDDVDRDTLNRNMGLIMGKLIIKMVNSQFVNLFLLRNLRGLTCELWTINIWFLKFVFDFSGVNLVRARNRMMCLQILREKCHCQHLKCGFSISKCVFWPSIRLLNNASVKYFQLKTSHVSKSKWGGYASTIFSREPRNRKMSLNLFIEKYQTFSKLCFVCLAQHAWSYISTLQ